MELRPLELCQHLTDTPHAARYPVIGQQPALHREEELLPLDDEGLLVGLQQGPADLLEPPLEVLLGEPQDQVPLEGHRLRQRERRPRGRVGRRGGRHGAPHWWHRLLGGTRYLPRGGPHVLDAQEAKRAAVAQDLAVLEGLERRAVPNALDQAASRQHLGHAQLLCDGLPDLPHRRAGAHAHLRPLVGLPAHGVPHLHPDLLWRAFPSHRRQGRLGVRHPEQRVDLAQVPLDVRVVVELRGLQEHGHHTDDAAVVAVETIRGEHVALHRQEELHPVVPVLGRVLALVLLLDLLQPLLEGLLHEARLEVLLQREDLGLADLRATAQGRPRHRRGRRRRQRRGGAPGEAPGQAPPTRLGRRTRLLGLLLDLPPARLRVLKPRADEQQLVASIQSFLVRVRNEPRANRAYPTDKLAVPEDVRAIEALGKGLPNFQHRVVAGRRQEDLASAGAVPDVHLDVLGERRLPRGHPGVGGRRLPLPEGAHGRRRVVGHPAKRAGVGADQFLEHTHLPLDLGLRPVLGDG
mmetsp:Transcript_99789/g.282387  ORF Transcript_99789/g.282387 Transcript_99789/m.282387 type:complete len:521 (-) Transcript_99789:235-1797(-)